MKDFSSLCGFFNTYDSVSGNRNGNSNNASTANRRYSGGTQNNRRFVRNTGILARFLRANRISSDQKSHSRVFFLMVTGILSIVAGCLVVFLQPYDAVLSYKLKLKEGGETFEMWRKPDVDLYLKVTLFNVTNKDKFLAGEEKLKIEEVGPYVYKEQLFHGNITFNENGTLSTSPYHPLTWMPELSEGRKEDDMLILPNIALLSIADVVKDSSYFTKMGLNLLFRQTDSHPLINITAKEFMFGYRSPLLVLGNKLMPSWLDFDKVGLIDRMYNFVGDYETVFTGEDDKKKSGLIDTYNGGTHLPMWEGNCGNIHGASDATKFPSLIQPNDTLVFFRKSVCRPMPQTRHGGLVYKNGLMAYRYDFKEGALDNGMKNTENKCYCRKGHCLPAGLIDARDCYYGFPIAISYPHFLEADPSLLEAVSGLHPNPELHKSYYYIEPTTGIPVEVAARFQINMALGDLSFTSRASQFKNMTLPMLWTEISMKELPKAINDKFYVYLVVLPIVQEVFIYVLFILGVLLLAASALHILCTYREFKSLLPNFSANERRNNYECASSNRNSVKAKELDVFYQSLIKEPLDNQKSNLHTVGKDGKNERRSSMKSFNEKTLYDIP